MDGKIAELHESSLKLQGTQEKDWNKISMMIVELFKKGSELGNFKHTRIV